jgi:hypothetical protein
MAIAGHGSAKEQGCAHSWLTKDGFSSSLLPMGKDNNLLTALHRWASRQDENFTTEAFAHMVRHLLTRDPRVAALMIQWLTDGRVAIAPGEARSVVVKTQATTTEGRPDVEILTAEHLVFVEAKVESGLGRTQLSRYRRAMAKSDRKMKILVLLTRYPLDVSVDDRAPDVLRRWRQLAEWILRELTREPPPEPVCDFVMRQFVVFLQNRGMTMNKVGLELEAGVESLWNLMKMLGEAIDGQGVQRERSVAKDWVGYYVQEKKGWVGVRWENPTKLFFHTAELHVGPNAAECVGYGRTKASPAYPNGIRWQLDMRLGSEEVHFFTLSCEDQMQEVERFVAKGIAALAKLIQATVEG